MSKLSKITNRFQNPKNQVLLIVTITIMIVILSLAIGDTFKYKQNEAVARIDSPYDNEYLADKRIQFKLILNPQSSVFPNTAILTSLVVKHTYNGMSATIYKFTDLSIVTFSIREFTYDLISRGNHMFTLYATFIYLDSQGHSVTVTYTDIAKVLFEGDL